MAFITNLDPKFTSSHLADADTKRVFLSFVDLCGDRNHNDRCVFYYDFSHGPIPVSVQSLSAMVLTCRVLVRKGVTLCDPLLFPDIREIWRALAWESVAANPTAALVEICQVFRDASLLQPLAEVQPGKKTAITKGLKPGVVKVVELVRLLSGFCIRSALMPWCDVHMCGMLLCA